MISNKLKLELTNMYLERVLNGRIQNVITSGKEINIILKQEPSDELHDELVRIGFKRIRLSNLETPASIAYYGNRELVYSLIEQLDEVTCY